MVDLDEETLVVWHEHNMAGAPEHVFGSHVVEGDPEDAMDDAWAWVDDRIAEELRNTRYKASSVTVTYGTGAAGELCVMTEMDKRMTYYSVVVTRRQKSDAGHDCKLMEKGVRK